MCDGQHLVVASELINSVAMLRLLCLCTLCFASTSFAQMLAVNSANSPFTISSAVTYTQVTVTSNGVLIINAQLTVTGDMLVQGAGRVTVSQAVMRLKLQVMGTLTVELGGVIDADGKGLPGAPAGGFGQAGVTLDTVTFAAVAGPTSGAGGSHASAGGNGDNGGGGTVSYGAFLLANPGGGGSTSAGGIAGSGGGVVELSATNLLLNGAIRANAENGLPAAAKTGGGAGGSVSLTIGSLSGAGTLAANGGSAYGGNGYGGAGRIIVTLTTWSFNGRFETLANGVHAGTMHVVDTLNRLYVVGPHIFAGGERYEVVLFKRDGQLTLQGSATVRTPVAVLAANVVRVSGAGALDAMNIGVIDGRVEVVANAVQQGDMLLRGTLVLDAELTVANFESEAPARVAHSPQITGMRLTATGSMHIAAGAAVQGSGLGAPPGVISGRFGTNGATYEPVTGVLVMGSGPSNGGSHAGLGGRPIAGNALAPAYDDPLLPQYGGGGGGAYYRGSNLAGGAGGGVLRLSANTLRLDGIVAVDGLSSAPADMDAPGGPGAGGSVVISTGALTGSGGIYARGGSSTYGAGGGGGIIRIITGSVASTVTRSVVGGSGPYPGGDGVLSESISAAVRILSAPPTQIKAGARLSYQAVATGSGAISWSLLTAPNGANASSTGVVSWAAVSGAPQSFSLQATNGSTTDVQTFTVTVTDAPTITSMPTTTATLGTAYLYDADGRAEAQGTGPLTWSLLAGPAGVTVDPVTGAVLWAPNALGSFAVCLRVSNSAGDAQQCFSVVVSGPAGDAGSTLDAGSVGVDAGFELLVPPAFTSSPSTTAFCGVPYHYSGSRLPEVSGSLPLTFSVSAIAGTLLPPGLAVDSASGALTWTPTNQQTGVHPIALTATNAAGSATQLFSVVVDCRVSQPVNVGCACNSPGASLGWFVVLGALGVLRRRRR